MPPPSISNLSKNISTSSAPITNISLFHSVKNITYARPARLLPMDEDILPPSSPETEEKQVTGTSSNSEDNERIDVELDRIRDRRENPGQSFLYNTVVPQTFDDYTLVFGLIAGLVFFALGHMVAVWAARHDPQFVDVARRHLRFPAYCGV